MHRCWAGVISGKFIQEGYWKEFVEKFRRKVDNFNKSKKALPHPGGMTKFKYCPICGAEVTDE